MRRAIQSSIILALIGCSGPTGYVESASFLGGQYGYTDKNIGDDEYAITVTGNPQTSMERIADVALLRAAHLADEQKRARFVILNKSSQQLQGYQIITIPIGPPVFFLPVSETPKQEPHAVLIIRLLPNDQPLQADAIDAARVIAELGPRLQ